MSSEQNPPTSKSKGIVKNILLIVLSILCLMLFAFGFIQKLEADKQRFESEKQRVLAEEAKMEAEAQRADAESMAMAAREEADKQRALAVEALAACEKAKKK